MTVSFNSITSAINPLHFFKVVSSDHSTLIGQKLQAAIMADDFEALELLKKDLTSQLLAQPLPNGELPLILAINNKKFAALAFLIKNGANPRQRDDQQLNAIEYAKLSPDPNVLARLLGSCIDLDIQTAKILIAQPISTHAIATFSKIQNVLEKCMRLKLCEIIESHMHQYGTTIESLQLLKHRPEIADVMVSTGLPFLHIIIACGQRELLKIYLEQPAIKSQVDQKDAHGLSALFYAVTTNRLDLAYDLVAKKAQLQLADSEGVTPMHLVGLSAAQVHPLKITAQEKFFFACSLLTWWMHFYGQATIPPVGFLLLNSGVAFAYQLSSGLNLMHSFKDNWQFLQYLAVKLLTQYVVPNSTLTSLFNVAELTALALKTFKGLQACWRNAHLGKGQALLKAFIACGPSIDQARLKLTFLHTAKTLSFPKTVRETEWLKNQAACVGLKTSERDTCEGWASTIFETCGYRADAFECTEAQRLFEQHQNICASSTHTLGVDIDAPATIVHKAYIKLALGNHPDKHTTDKEAAEAHFVKINKAYEDYKRNCL